MGLAVAEGLSKRGDWHCHLLDLNEASGTKAASTVKNATFHQCNVSQYSQLASIFQTIFSTTQRLDFVFANAGIVERDNFYRRHPTDGPPPEPNQLVIDINLKAVVSTVYLAQHYFRQNTDANINQTIISTASCGGLYPSPFSAMYSASKHGVVGLTRSVAKPFWRNDRIRVHCTCPGTVRTNLLDAQGWANFPEEYFTPVEKIVSTVLMLVDGGKMEDSKGVTVGADEAYGLAVEINGQNHYFRSQPDWCDDNMRAVMEATDVEELKK